MKKSVKISIVCLALLLVLALGAELALGWFAYSRLTEGSGLLSGLREDNAGLRGDLTGIRTEVSGLQGSVALMQSQMEDMIQAAQAPEDPAQEDDVTIYGSYRIRSTLPISDAYKSGDRSGLSDKEKETLDMAAAILAEIITPEMDAYEKEVAVYTWMTENLGHDEGLLPVIPRTQADCDNPYGVLKYHNAVCVGYATTFRLFMQMLDIPCMVVHNTERYHSWDLVQLDGGWYHTDIYSDAGRASFNHFNLTDTMQSMNQSWNTEFFPPANQTEYCYLARNAREEDDLYHIPAALREAIDAHDNHLALRFDSSLREMDARVAELMLDNIRDRVAYGALSDTLYLDWSWMSLEDGWLLSIRLEWYDSGEDPEPEEIPDEAYEKSYEAVEEAFGDLEDNSGEVWWDSADDLSLYAEGGRG